MSEDINVSDVLRHDRPPERPLGMTSRETPGGRHTDRPPERPLGMTSREGQARFWAMA